MLIPSLHVQDLRDQPTTLRVTDATSGYGEGGNPTRAEITSANITVVRWIPDAPGWQWVLSADLPLDFIKRATPVDLAYPHGCDVAGDGLLVFYLSLYSDQGVPQQKATYRADFCRTIATATERLLVNRNGAWELVSSVPNGATAYAEEATLDVLTEWRIEYKDTSLPVTSGHFVRSAVFVSAMAAPVDGDAPRLIIRHGQPVLLLGRSRRRLNQLSEKMIFSHHFPLPQFLSDGLVWLRLYEQLAELEFGGYDGASPYRQYNLLNDFHQTLSALWLRHG